MNKLLDIDKILKNPKKYGFEKVNSKHKGNSIAIIWNTYLSSANFCNYHYVYDELEDMMDNYRYDLEGITIEKSNLLENFMVSFELRR